MPPATLAGCWHSVSCSVRSSWWVAWKIYDAASGPRDLWILDDIGHTGAFEHDRVAFVERLDDFFTAGLRPFEAI
jgi:hypothetical protein